ncbi:hypothetical protein SEA_CHARGERPOWER_90 [Mycobacterium phage Chargerpower]|nr:hypothetical protein SEA_CHARGERPOWER_90 [Mycobacterium phage Chargerpower]
MDPVTTLSVFIDGHHEVLDTVKFRADLRHLLREYVGHYSFIISVDESKV